jgi:hypothetical protein
MRRLTSSPFNGLFYNLREHQGTLQVRHAEFDSASGYFGRVPACVRITKWIPFDNN